MKVHHQGVSTMKKILLLCGAGISTGILVDKLEEARDELGKDDYEFEATTIEQADRYVPEADVVLIAPDPVPAQITAAPLSRSQILRHGYAHVRNG